MDATTAPVREAVIVTEGLSKTYSRRGVDS